MTGVAHDPLAAVRVVCARPLYGGNVGAICRAMMNMGLRELALVSPSPGLDVGETRKMALHAFSIFEARREFTTVREAVADCVAVAATTARDGLYREHARTLREWAPDLLRVAQSGPVALLFGSEDKGLSNEELKLATHLIRIPTSPAYSSINLAQAVLLCAYELYVQADQFRAPEERSPLASLELRERMLDIWQETLLEIGFMKEDKSDHMMMGLRRILSRDSLTENDVKILMGIAKQSQWAARNPSRHPAQPPCE